MTQKTRSELFKLVRPHEDDDDESSVGDFLRQVEVAVEPVPSAFGRVAASIAVVVRIVMAAVRIVHGVALGRLVDAVPSVVQTFLAVARLVADSVLEQIEAVDPLADGRTIAVELDVVAAFEAVVAAVEAVAFFLLTKEIIVVVTG